VNGDSEWGRGKPTEALFIASEGNNVRMTGQGRGRRGTGERKEGTRGNKEK
jgi:hypothetical protein